MQCQKVFARNCRLALCVILGNAFDADDLAHCLNLPDLLWAKFEAALLECSLADRRLVGGLEASIYAGGLATAVVFFG